MTDRKGVKGHRANLTWMPGEDTKAFMLRMLEAFEKMEAVSVVREGPIPAYVVMQGTPVKPIELWRACRLVMDGRTDVPDATARRVSEAFKLNNPQIATDADCGYILTEWKFRYGNGNCNCIRRYF